MVPQVHHSAAAASFARLAALCLQHVGPSRTFGVQQNVSLRVNSGSPLTLKLSPGAFNVLQTGADDRGASVGSTSTATVPGVGGGGAGEVGGVGLPESTGGQGGVDGLTLPDHSTAEGERRQRLEPFSITAERLLELNPPPPQNLQPFQFRCCSMQN